MAQTPVAFVGFFCFQCDYVIIALSPYKISYLFSNPDLYFAGSLVGAIVNNMKGHLEPTYKKLHIYSAVSNRPSFVH